MEYKSFYDDLQLICQIGVNEIIMHHFGFKYRLHKNKDGTGYIYLYFSKSEFDIRDDIYELMCWSSVDERSKGPLCIFLSNKYEIDYDNAEIYKELLLSEKLRLVDWLKESCKNFYERETIFTASELKLNGRFHVDFTRCSEKDVRIISLERIQYCEYVIIIDGRSYNFDKSLTFKLMTETKSVINLIIEGRNMFYLNELLRII
jgi:hypothetical protein